MLKALREYLRRPDSPTILHGPRRSDTARIGPIPGPHSARNGRGEERDLTTRLEEHPRQWLHGGQELETRAYSFTSHQHPQTPTRPLAHTACPTVPITRPDVTSAKVTSGRVLGLPVRREDIARHTQVTWQFTTTTRDALWYGETHFFF